MKAKKKSFGIQLISILVVVAIISVGFAAWIITSPIAGDSVQGGFIAQDYIDNTFTISIDIENVDADDSESADKQLTFGKPVDPVNAAPAFFKNGYKFSWFDYSKDDVNTVGVDEGTPNEVMSVTFKVIIDPTEDADKKIEDLLLDRSVMISLTLNNAQQRWVDGGDADDHFEEVKKDNEGNYVTDSESTAAYALYSKAHDLTLSKPIDTKQVDLFTNDELIAEPKMECYVGNALKATSDYTHNIYKSQNVTGYNNNDVWSDDNAISIVLQKDAFVKVDTNFVAEVKLTVDWGTYFDIWYNDQNTIVEANTANATHITNVNPYYFFNLQNIYKDGNNWIEEAKEAIDTIFALNYTAANDKTVGNVSGSGVQYQLSIHPIPYVDVNK